MSPSCLAAKPASVVTQVARLDGVRREKLRETISFHLETLLLVINTSSSLGIYETTRDGK